MACYLIQSLSIAKALNKIEGHQWLGKASDILQKLEKLIQLLFLCIWKLLLECWLSTEWVITYEYLYIKFYVSRFDLNIKTYTLNWFENQNIHTELIWKWNSVGKNDLNIFVHTLCFHNSEMISYNWPAKTEKCIYITDLTIKVSRLSTLS